MNPGHTITITPTDVHVEVRVDGTLVAASDHPVLLEETGLPVRYYLPRADVRMDLLVPVGRTSFCEWKGTASYFDVEAGDRVEAAAAWTYRNPPPPFAALRGFVSLYPGRMDACFLDDERVDAQPGDFYGGWITHEITGPFKGGPGTRGW